MIEQLVGQKCVRCQKPIESIVEGAFCPGCARPVHGSCMCPGLGDLPERCERCGNLIDDPDAVQQRLVELQSFEQARTQQIALREADGYDFGRRWDQLRQDRRSSVVGAVGCLLVMSAMAGLAWLIMQILPMLGGGHSR
jgi:hypothetical protein